MLTNQARQSEARTPLNQWVELWSPRLSTTKDETGADIDKEGKVAAFWANVSRTRATETTEVGRTVPFAYYKIIIHWRDDIDEAMYLKYQGKELEINSIIDLQERHMYLELQCTERVRPNG